MGQWLDEFGNYYILRQPAPSPAPPLPRSVIDAQKELTLKEDMRIDRLAPQAPLPAEVEEAMEEVESAFDYAATYDRWTEAGDRERYRKILATIRAALTEARQPKVVSIESGRVSPTGGKQQESEMTAEEPK